MNLLDAWVTVITGSVFERYGKFWLPIQYVSEGRHSKMNLMCDTKEEAESIKVGYKFQT